MSQQTTGACKLCKAPNITIEWIGTSLYAVCDCGFSQVLPELTEKALPMRRRHLLDVARQREQGEIITEIV